MQTSTKPLLEKVTPAASTLADTVDPLLTTERLVKEYKIADVMQLTSCSTCHR